MGHRFALLLDGGFVTKRLAPRGGPAVKAHDVLQLFERIEHHPALAGLVLLRRNVYDAPPARGRIENPLDGHGTDLGSTPVFSTQMALLDEIELLPNTSLRRGDIALRG